MIFRLLHHCQSLPEKILMPKNLLYPDDKLASFPSTKRSALKSLYANETSVRATWPDGDFPTCITVHSISHFQVAFCLCVKTSLHAKPFM